MSETFRPNYELPTSSRELPKTPGEIKTEEIVKKLKAKKQLSEGEKAELKIYESSLEDMRKIRTGEDEEQTQQQFERIVKKLDDQIDKL